MKNILTTALLAAVLTTFSTTPAATSAQTKSVKFTAADIASAGLGFVPVRIAGSDADSIAVGVVTLSLSLDASGKIQNVEVQRDVPSLTSAVQDTVKTWTFTPASYKGSPIPSTLSVNVVFQPNQLTTAPNGGMALAPPQAPPTPENCRTGVRTLTRPCR